MSIKGVQIQGVKILALYQGQAFECYVKLNEQTILHLLDEISGTTKIPLGQISIVNLKPEVLLKRDCLLENIKDQLEKCDYTLKIGRKLMLQKRTSLRSLLETIDAEPNPDEPQASSSKRFKDDIPLQPGDRISKVPKVVFPERLNSRFDNEQLYTKIGPGMLCVNSIDYIPRICTSRKLVVLDIDKTIYDGRGKEHHRASRPGLKDFLEEIYKEYDLAIWSSTDLKKIQEKLDALNIFHDKKFPIIFCLDNTSNTTTIEHATGTNYNIKSLRTLWTGFPEYNEKNTLICDDMEQNIDENKLNGVLVEKYEHTNFETDRVLRHLKNYLLKISGSDDLSKVDHTDWEIRTGPPEEEEAARRAIEQERKEQQKKKKKGKAKQKTVTCSGTFDCPVHSNFF